MLLLDEADQFADTIFQKLSGRLESNQFVNFTRCGKEEIYRTCKDCSQVEKFAYRCNLKWCPRCQWRLSAKRKDLLTLWATKIKQPKHLVLTQKNFPILTRRKLKEHSGCLAALRRRKLFSQVKGGCVSVEITNEDRGWHLHSHWLLDVRFIPIERISRVWGELVGQEFAICKIMDVRHRDYAQEICKYVCDGSEIAKWPAEHIHEFVTAIRGRRFFGSFGSLRKLSPMIRAELEAEKPEPVACNCGCSEFRFESETQTVVNEVRALERSGRQTQFKRPTRASLLKRSDSVTVGATQLKISTEHLV